MSRKKATASVSIPVLASKPPLADLRPKLAPKLATKSAPQLAPKIDRRVRRTRDRLGDAIIGLMQEKPFETITVQQVLARAGVGRSTFYSHYRDKDDLFLSDLEEFLEMMSTLILRRNEASNRVAPVRELFAHVAEMTQLRGALLAADKYRDFLEMAQEYFARAIDQRLVELPAARTVAPAQRTAMAHAFAGALLSLMSWWLEHGATTAPETMDDLYHKMDWSGVAAESAASLAKGRR
jgi:AcrR family transcriptional regulator